MASSSSWLNRLRSVPLGRYWRSSPLVFSQVPRMAEVDVDTRLGRQFPLTRHLLALVARQALAPRAACIESAAMRRWLILLALFVLPLQWVWGAAAPYCGHESAALAKHFGHHEHRHQGGEAVAIDASADRAGLGDEDEAAAAYHADCESCHLGASPAPTLQAPGLPPVPSRDLRVEPGPPWRSHIPSMPERPDRIELTAAARFAGGVEFRPLPD